MAKTPQSIKPQTQAEPAGEPGRTIAGIRLSAIVEIALFIGGSLIVDQLFFGGTRFRSAWQHPFWIPVLLTAAQYGTNAGLFATVAASAALLSGKLPPHPISQDRFTWWFELAKLPLAWFVAALVLGELRMRQIRERAALREQLTETSRREQIVSDAYRRLNEVREALETRLASQMKTAVGLYESARAIEKLDPSAVVLGITALVRAIVNPEQFSTYLLQNGRLQLAAREGWSGEEGVRRQYGPETQLFVEVVARQRALSVANPDDAAVLMDAGVAAVPIVVPDGGPVVGMLKIEKLGFLELTFSNLQMLKALGRWIGSAYDNAVRYQAACAETVVNTDTELLSYGFFSRQVSFLSLLAARVGFDLAMIVVRLDNEADLTMEQRAATARAFGRAASQALRKTDLAFEYGRTGTEFALLLPASPVSHADVVVQKFRASLSEQLRDEAPDAQVSFAIHVIHEGSKDEASTTAPPKTALIQDLLEITKAVEPELERQHHG